MTVNWHISKTLIWLRFRERLVVLTNAPMLFSERNGYTQYRPLPFGWRLSTR